MAFKTWQERAGFDRIYGFHALRHSGRDECVPGVRDLFLAQRFARHASPLTTTIYTHIGDEELMQGVRTLTC